MEAARYGRVRFRLGYAEAVRQDIILDYKVHVIVLANSSPRRRSRSQKYVSGQRNPIAETQTVTVRVGLLRTSHDGGNASDFRCPPMRQAPLLPGLAEKAVQGMPGMRPVDAAYAIAVRKVMDEIKEEIGGSAVQGFSFHCTNGRARQSALLPLWPRLATAVFS